MLPMFVLADSDIDEEELKPILLKLKKKLRKVNKLERTGDVCVSLATNSSIDSIPDDSSTTSFDSSNSTDVNLTSPADEEKKSATERGNKKCRKRKRREIEDVINTKDSLHLCTLCGKTCSTSTNREKRRKGEFGCTCNSVHKSTNSTLALSDSQILVNPESDLSYRVVALDCEFVGVGPQKLSALGRCSIVNYHGDLILDIYAYPNEPITDYRTPWSGIRKRDMVSAVPFASARNTILKILRDKIVIGHAVFNDFKVLKLSHPVHCVRDTFNCKPLRERSSALGQGFSLKKLTKALLGRDIQTGEHCSKEDAIAALDLYKLVQSEWEEKLSSKMCKNKKMQPEISLNCDTLFLGDKFWPSTLNDNSEPSSI